MINAQILALREKIKHEKKLKKAAPSPAKREDSLYKRARSFSGIACGIAPVERSINWAMKYSNQQDNFFMPNALNTSLKRANLKRPKT